ncbi:anti-anti-sigma factor [Streptomyces sp. NPDC101209]|uniref:anti-anti-sigma factor n=1 Tax=Streptomyces sp. NPDC101209 TaxID=3366129 RepID=UPI00381E9546
MTATADGVRVLRLSGEIGHGTGVILRDGLKSADGARPRTVLHGLHWYQHPHRRPPLAPAGGRLRLAGPSGSVRRTLRIAAVDDIIDCRDTLHQALSI